MTGDATPHAGSGDAETRSVIVERRLPHAPEKVWRALTEGALLSAWLMPTDFEPRVGHRFSFRVPANAHWNGVTEGEVMVVEPPRRLAYSWNASGDEAATGIRTVVTWTLTPEEGGVLLRMEQSGFRPHEGRNVQGAEWGWQKFLGQLEAQLAAAPAGQPDGSKAEG